MEDHVSVTAIASALRNALAVRLVPVGNSIRLSLDLASAKLLSSHGLHSTAGY